MDFLIVLLYYPLEHKADPSQIGLVRMSSFLLQTLSAEKGFASNLNRPFEGHSALPSSVRLSNFHGTYADFMIVVFPSPFSVDASLFTISSQLARGTLLHFIQHSYARWPTSLLTSGISRRRRPRSLSPCIIV